MRSSRGLVKEMFRSSWASRAACAVVVCVSLISVASGNVLDMGGTYDASTGTWTGSASLATVSVGNAGNAADPTTGLGQVNYAYNIGTYEVTAAQYCEFLNAVASTDTYSLYNASMATNARGCGITQTGSAGSYTYSVSAANANRPVNYVSFGDACRFTNWLQNGQPTGGQDLTTTEDGAYYLNGAVTASALQSVVRGSSWEWAVANDNEWYKAAYYDPASASYNLYPTSSNTAPGTSQANPDTGNNMIGFVTGQTTSSAPIASCENSPSPYGTFDQAGNIWERTETRPNATNNDCLGSRFDWAGATSSSATAVGVYPMVSEHYVVGFRVVETPEPMTMGLLAVGGIVALLRRRRMA
jgi:sulfatase modifying factor 1